MDIDPTNTHTPEIYTVIARETPFKLSRSQIEADSPNYFTAAFLDGGFAESQSRTIRIDKHPLLINLIVEHLSGYKILPLQPSVLPRYMSVEAAMENLWRDASYFGLDALCKELKLPQSQMEIPPALADGYESIIDLSRIQKDGGLVLSLGVESPYSYHIEGIDGLPLFRARDIPVRLCLQDAEDEPYFQASKTLLALIDWPAQISTIQTDQGQGIMTRRDHALYLGNDCGLNISGQPVAPRTLEALMKNWELQPIGPLPLDLPQHSIMDQRLTENDIWDINFNRAGDLFPVMELVAEELVFELVRGATSDTGSGGLNTLFKVN